MKKGYGKHSFFLPLSLPSYLSSFLPSRPFPTFLPLAFIPSLPHFFPLISHLFPASIRLGRDNLTIQQTMSSICSNYLLLFNKPHKN